MPEKFFLNPHDSNFFEKAYAIDNVTGHMIHGLSSRDMFLVLKFFQKYRPLVKLYLDDPVFLMKNRPAIFYVLRKQKQPDIVAKSIMAGRDHLFDGLDDKTIYLLSEGCRYYPWFLTLILVFSNIYMGVGDNAILSLLNEKPNAVKLVVINYLYILGLQSLATKSFCEFCKGFTNFELLACLDYACAPLKSSVTGDLL